MSVIVNPGIFRAYDIRGRAGVELTPAFAEALGAAFGTVIARSVAGRPKETALAEGVRPKVAIGRDCRPHGVELAEAFEKGVRRVGVDVLRLGMVPTPLVYFAIHHFELAGGVAITGSHNPPAWNGFKLCDGPGSMHGDAIQELRRIIEGDGYRVVGFEGQGQGSAIDLGPTYVKWHTAKLAALDPPPTVVLDAGNGAGGPVGQALLEAMGAKVIPLFCEPDGDFPNHHPDPTVEANLDDLKAAVKAHGADLGLALDGDADRLGAVDRHGRVVWGDQLLLYFARRILAEQPGARIVGEVKCSRVLYDGVKAAGGVGEMWKVGHSLIKARMKETGALLAGEMSGHLFFADRYFGFDDGVYAAARLVEAIGSGGPALDAFVDGLPETVTTPELRVACPDQSKFAVAQRAAAHFAARYASTDIDGVRIDFPHGWGLLRPSNTQPVLVMRFEADSAENLMAYRAEVEAWLRTEAPEVDLEADTHH